MIAATNRDLGADLERGAFREDLYYRLRRVILEVPPLRARRDDIPLLIEHVRVRGNERYGLAVEGVTRQAVALLQDSPWFGNVRELEAVLEEAMILRAVGWVTPADLNVGPARVRTAPGRVHEGDSEGPGLLLPLTWSQREALRVAAERREVRRRDLMVRCDISREVARRELALLARGGLLERLGRGRAARYVLPTPARARRR